jgi:hypothetical protein
MVKLEQFAGDYELEQQLPDLTGALGGAALAEGDVSGVPFVALMRHCEDHALTCTIAVTREGDTIELTYRAGEIKEITRNGKPDEDAIVDATHWENARFRVSAPPLDMDVEGWPVVRPSTEPFTITDAVKAAAAESAQPVTAKAVEAAPAPAPAKPVEEPKAEPKPEPVVEAKKPEPEPAKPAEAKKPEPAEKKQFDRGKGKRKSKQQKAQPAPATVAEKKPAAEAKQPEPKPEPKPEPAKPVEAKQPEPAKPVETKKPAPAEQKAKPAADEKVITTLKIDRPARAEKAAKPVKEPEPARGASKDRPVTAGNDRDVLWMVIAFIVLAAALGAVAFLL